MFYIGLYSGKAIVVHCTFSSEPQASVAMLTLFKPTWSCDLELLKWELCMLFPLIYQSIRWLFLTWCVSCLMSPVWGSVCLSQSRPTPRVTLAHPWQSAGAAVPPSLRCRASLSLQRRREVKVNQRRDSDNSAGSSLFMESPKSLCLLLSQVWLDVERVPVFSVQWGVHGATSCPWPSRSSLWRESWS